MSLAAIALYCSPLTHVSSFVPAKVQPGLLNSRFTTFLASTDMDEEIDRRLEHARELLQKSKAKLADKEEGSELPFFASEQTRGVISREGVIKSKNEETGLITADGEKMAALSEQEDWEPRSILEVFENEINENEDVYSMTSQQLASRDVAASIWNLRKELQGGDYLKIFDKRNRFIQEE